MFIQTCYKIWLALKQRVNTYTFSTSLLLLQGFIKISRWIFSRINIARRQVELMNMNERKQFQKEVGRKRVVRTSYDAGKPAI